MPRMKKTAKMTARVVDPYVANLLEKISEGKRVLNPKKGEKIFSQGERADAIFFLQSGKVKITVLSQAGKEAVIAVLGPRSFLGEGALVGQPLRISTATALAPSSIFRIERHSMLRALHEQVELSEKFIAALLVRNIDLEEDLCDQLFNHSEKRLARVLLKLARLREHARIYHLAVDLIGRTGYRISAESIVSYLDAYQHQAPLTIAELWVFPLMLRLVLLRRLQVLSESASLRQHQKEMADFWANRLLNAVRHGPKEFEGIIAELDRDGNELTPHFIARLGEQLHREESALAPIQKWIEAKTDSHLADIILRDHTEEANDLMFISTAIGSLRQLSELQYPEIVEAVSRMESILREDPSDTHARSDFATRDRCRRVVEECARQSKTPEWDVARLAVQLAQSSPKDTLAGCVAFYLLDEGLAELERHIRRRLPCRDAPDFGTVVTCISGVR